MKNCGKSTFSKLLASKLGLTLLSTDTELEKIHEIKTGETLTFREIFKKYGADYFIKLETEALIKIVVDNKREQILLDTGGGVPLQEINRKILNQLGEIIYIKLNKEINFSRMMKHGTPAFFKYQDDPGRSFEEIWEERSPIYKSITDILVDVTNETPEEIVEKYLKQNK